MSACCCVAPTLSAVDSRNGTGDVVRLGGGDGILSAVLLLLCDDCESGWCTGAATMLSAALSPRNLSTL